MSLIVVGMILIGGCVSMVCIIILGKLPGLRKQCLHKCRDRKSSTLFMYTNLTMQDCFKHFLLIVIFFLFVVLGASGSRHGQAGRGGWALPSNELPHNPGGMIAEARDKVGSSRSHKSGKMRADVRDGSGSSHGRAKD